VDGGGEAVLGGLGLGWGSSDWDCLIEERTLSPGGHPGNFYRGITEAFQRHGEEFGEERLSPRCRGDIDNLPAGHLSAVVDEVRRFSGQ